MKKIVSLIVVAMFIGIAPTTIHAQGLLNVLGEKAKEKVKEKVEKKVQKAVKIDAEPKAEPEEVEAPVKETKVSKSVESNYAKSDFVPGDVIFFEDNLEGEQLGEFPSRWDLNNGTAEVAKHDGKMVIFLENDDAQYGI